MSHLKSFTIYASTTFFNAAVSFATFSILTHHLNEVDYGIINLYNSFLIFLVPFVSAGVQFTLSVDYFKMGKQAYTHHFKNSVIIPLFSCLLFTAVCVVFSPHISSFIGVALPYVWVLPLLCLITTLSDILLNLVRNREQHYLFAGISAAKNVFEIGFTILFVVLLGQHWEGRINSNIITLVVLLAAIIFFLKRWGLFSGRYDSNALKRIFFLSLPFIPERLAIFILGYSDRFFINYYEGTDDVGYYSAGAQIAIMVNLVCLTLANTFHPVLFKRLSANEIDYRAVRKACYSYLLISLSVAIATILLTPVIFEVFIGRSFQPGQQYAVNLVIGFFFWSVYNLFLGFLLNHKRNKAIMNISLVSMGLSLVLNLVLVRYFGALGATYTNIIVYTLMAAISLYLVSRHYSLKRIFWQPLES